MEVLSKSDLLLSKHQSIEFDQCYNIGQCVKGAHWKDLPVLERIKDVSISLFKLLLTVAIIGTITFFALSSPIAPLITFLVVGIILALGLSIISHSIFKLHRIDHLSQGSFEIPYLAPKLGESSSASVMVTHSGAESMEMKLRLIQSAQHSIEISGSYCGGEVFDRTLDAIKLKLKSNPQLLVKIIANKSLITRSNRVKISELQDKYPDFIFLETGPKLCVLPTLRAIENHTKLFIVDGTHCLTGGTGLQDLLASEGQVKASGRSLTAMFVGKGTRDMDALFTGPIALTMRQQFYYLFRKWSIKAQDQSSSFLYKQIDQETIQLAMAKKEIIYQGKSDRLEENSLATLIVSSYEQGSANSCLAAHINMIKSARHTITIGNMIFSEPRILLELKKAVERGVKIRIITNLKYKKATFGNIILAIVNRNALQSLIRSGVNCYSYDAPCILYHKKVMVIDNQITVIGSFNFSYHCADTEDENIIVIKSRKISENALRVLDEDLIRSSFVKPLPIFFQVINSFMTRVLLFFTKFITQ